MQQLVLEILSYLSIFKIRRVFKKISRIPPSSEVLDANVIIERLDRGWFFLLVDFLLASLIERRGARVQILIDRSELLDSYDNESPYIAKSRRQQSLANLIRRYRSGMIVRRYLEKLIRSTDKNIKLTELSDIVSVKESQSVRSAIMSSTVDDIQGVVLDSHRRKFGGRVYNCEDEDHQEFAKINLYQYRLLSLAAERLKAQSSPHLYIALDGTYVTRGTITDYMRNSGVQVLIYRPDGFQSRGMFLGDRPYTVNTNISYWDLWLKNLEPESEFLGQGRSFVEERIEKGLKGSVSDDVSKFIEEQKKQGRKILILFPNLTWDGAITQRDKVFDSLTDWIVGTIEWANQNNYSVLLREHPQPKTLYSSFDSVSILLQEEAPQVFDQDNFFLISALDKTSSYRLISDYVDASVTYGGTLTVEVAYMGKPVILAAQSQYSGKKLGYEPKDKNAYFNLLMDTPVAQSSQQESAIKVAAYQFYGNSHYLPLFPKMDSWNRYKRSQRKYLESWDISSLSGVDNVEWKKTIQVLDYYLNAGVKKAADAE